MRKSSRHSRYRGSCRMSGYYRSADRSSEAKVNKGMEDIDGMHRMSDVRSAIATMSSFRRIDDETEVGMGCWPGLSDDLRATDSIILVGAGEAAKWNGTQKLEKVTKPRIGGILLYIGSSDSVVRIPKAIRTTPKRPATTNGRLRQRWKPEVLFSRWRGSLTACRL